MKNIIKNNIQQEQSDCGICCLETIINYYGGYVPLEILRMETETNNEGTNALKLIECANKYGLNGIGINKVKLNNIKLPVIAHFKIDDYLLHFVVIYKISKNNIYIMDPSIGKRKISYEVFNSLFTGIVLEFTPISAIPKLEKKNIVMKLIKDNIIINKKSCILIILITFLLLITTFLISLEVKLLIRSNYYISIYILLILFHELMMYIKNKKLLLLNQNINNNLICKFINKLFKLPSSYLNLKKSGETIVRFNEINDLSSDFVTTLLTLIFNLFLLIILNIFLYYVNRLIFLYSILFSIFIVILNYFMFSKIYNSIIYNIKLEESYKNNIINYISNFETIKHINILDYFINKIKSNNKEKNIKTFLLNKNILRINSIRNIIISLVNLLFIIFIIKYENINNGMLLIVIFNYLMLCIQNIIDLFPNILYLKSIINKINEFLSLDLLDNRVIKTFKCLRVCNLNYKINNKVIFSNLNLFIKNGEKILIKGPSGIGKSTLMKFINKEYDNYDGNIFIDNNNINEIVVNNLVKYCGQNDALFNDSILNNIVLERDIDNNLFNKVINICRINNINIVKDFGLNAILLNNAINISGGERNRIILARTLLCNNEIIILDEVLSQTDILLEQSIIRDINNYFKNKTIIFISHRNVSKLFDRVIYL